MKTILYCLKRIASSRVGQILFILHLSLVIFDFGHKPPVRRAESNVVRRAGELQSSSVLLAGRGFHWHYESSLLKFLVLVDIPGLLLSFLIGLILVPIFYVFLPLGAYDASWFTAGIFLLGTSIQWQVIGFWLEQVVRRRKNAD